MNPKKQLKLMYSVVVLSVFFAVFTQVDHLDYVMEKIREVIGSLSISGILLNKESLVVSIFPDVILWCGQILIAGLIIFFGLLGIRVGVKDKIASSIINPLQKNKKYFFIVGAAVEMIWAAFFYASFTIPYADIFVFIAMQCFAFKIVLDEHDSIEWRWICLVVALGILCKLYSDRNFVLRAALLIFASKDIELKKVMKWYLAINIPATIVIILLSACDVTGTWMEVDAYRALNEVANRYVMGFNSPNTTHFIIVRLILVAMYIWWDKIKWYHAAIILILNQLLFMLTDSRTSMIVGLGAGLFIFFFKYAGNARNWKIWYILAGALVLFLVVFSLQFLRFNFYQYDDLHECPGWVYFVNDHMVGRIHQMLKFRQGVEISPFGTFRQGVYIDMGYVKLFLQEGFLAFILYIGTVLTMIKHQYYKRDYAGFIIVVLMSIRMLMESSFVPFVFQNMILLLLVSNWNQLTNHKMKYNN